MKVIFLNAWHGEMRDNLRAFINSQVDDTDVFCFMELNDDDARQTCQDIFADNFQVKKSFKQVLPYHFPLITYVRNNLSVTDTAVLFEQKVDTGLALVMRLDIAGQDVFIASVHGIPGPGNKLDTPGRLEQSKGIIDFLADKNGLKIVGGGFNLLPDTESIKMFEKAGYRNLIKDYNIATTRNHLCWDRFPDNKQMYADFTFVSPNIDVKNFTVPTNEASDHLPQILEITL